MLSHLLNKKLGDYNDLLRQGECICVPKNTKIVDREKGVGPVYYLKSGVVALTDILEDGDERIYRYHRIGEFLGVFQLYNQVPGLPHAPVKTVNDIYDSVTKTESVLYKIDPEVFLRYAYENPEILVEHIRMVAKVNMNHCVRYTRMLKNLTANIICEVLLDFSVERDGVYRMDKYFTYAEIARYLGVHVVTVGRIMKKLSEEGIVGREGGQIVILDRERLTEYSNGKKIKY